MKPQKIVAVEAVKKRIFHNELDSWGNKIKYPSFVSKLHQQKPLPNYFPLLLSPFPLSCSNPINQSTKFLLFYFHYYSPSLRFETRMMIFLQSQPKYSQRGLPPLFFCRLLQIFSSTRHQIKTNRQTQK